jgi:hypothetical protein
MKSIKLLGYLLSSISLSLAFASPAQSARTSAPIPTNSNRTCQQEIDSVGIELASKGAFVPFNRPGFPGFRVQPEVFIENGNFSQNYSNYPTNRSQMVKFKLSGDPDRIWLGVMSSPQFLTTLASQIMAACPQVGMVDYRHWWEGHVPVGYFSDGTSQAFTWVDYDDPRTTQWGYYYSH